MNDGGSIILNGSVASVKGTPAFGVYGATKAALRSFVRTWTSDLKDRHIRSNVISPGPTDTPAVDGQPADAIARIVSTIPMGRMGDPEEIAKAALFLASELASGITGEVLVDFIVDPNGVVRNAVAVRATQREFEEAACAAVGKWKFRPGRKGGVAVFVHMQVPIVFTLNAGD